ncbi:BrnT family toxin [Agrobacterium genomosp. 3 str. CIP 111-78]|uniref:BrnT family toxin n=1 Tax=Agrobacterium tumefaciens TaxID=358 RepID=A0AAE6EKC5_AGRTU|nr:MULTISPECIES: BrnT family toxin [Rhizobium/Agrobacterium group]MCA2375058.1 BrnT family toxin [Agrobacterium tomkonis CIP 111-78]MCD4659210.1 BrnT family toxin [Agrobacterium sp.]MCZ7453171.1 BrnT family toxin [Rhizobium rhizogenes]QCM00451.1 BrnT family toxin [Agrobacterium tumefaciens]
MVFEFDPVKSAGNKDKHGIDFVDAQALWHDKYGLTVTANGIGEERLALIALLGEKLWLAVHTLRGGRIRIISVRRARELERHHYEDHKRRRIRQDGR